MRISRHQMFMEIASVAAKRATCSRLAVGAVLVHKNNLVSIGYNGVPAGEPHCAGNACPGKHACHLTTHAEVNALDRCENSRLRGLDLYVTHSPCPDCMTNLIRDQRVTRIFFGALYRRSEHLEGSLIPLFSVTPSGYVMDYQTKELIDAV